MSSLQPKNVAISSLLGGYGGIRQTAWTPMSVSGTLANGNTANFTATISANQSNSNYMWDLFGYNVNSNPSLPNNVICLNTAVAYGIAAGLYLSSSGSGSETAKFTSTWNPSTNSFVVTLSVFNGTGGSITLTTQTINFAGFFYAAPF